MFFLHALATKRKQLLAAGDTLALKKLPVVTVFEKSSSPGGVWRSDRNKHAFDETTCNSNSDNAEEGASTNMYEGLWINGHKEGMEFFDYTFEEHFKSPTPAYLPRQRILEYIMARVSLHEDIFQNVLFNTSVLSVTYDKEFEQFVVSAQNSHGKTTTQLFDKCIWASGLNGKPRIPYDLLQKLKNFNGKIAHSSAMDRIASLTPCDHNNAVQGKRILMVGDSYSAEDLALQCIKLGAEKIYITTRTGEGSASYMGSWPENKVEMLWYSQIAGVKEDGKTIMCDTLNNDYAPACVNDISIIIFCTGYEPNLHFLDEELQPWKKHEDCGVWCLEDFGENSETWRMKENAMTEALGHVAPSKELELNSDYIVENSYRRVLIKNPSMMFIYEQTSYPLLEIDVAAWLSLAYITGELPIPTEEEMVERNKRELLDSMHELSVRYEIDNNFSAAWCALPSDHWSNDTSCSKYRSYLDEYNSYEIRILARDMKDAKYPLQLGDIHNLNTSGLKLLKMLCDDCIGRYTLSKCDGETKKWKTFRDIDPTPFRSLVTDMASVPLKGKWLEIDDDGNPLHDM
jgi:Predicted flavoprotein involved in K+ transport